MPERRAMADLFPGAVPEGEVLDEARRRGLLKSDHQVACITVCREPSCRTIEHPIRTAYPTIFDYYSLGGIPTIGRVSMQQSWMAAEAGGVVYFTFTHVALCPPVNDRAVQIEGCHGLECLLHDIATRRIEDRVDPYDWEYTLLRRAFLGAGAPGAVDWNTVSLAKFMARAAADIAHEKLVTSRCTDAAFSVVSGVHVACAESRYVWLNPEVQEKRAGGRNRLPASERVAVRDAIY